MVIDDVTAYISEEEEASEACYSVASLGFVAPMMLLAVAKKVVEEEGDGYYMYCKRGRREDMEDRYSATLNILVFNGLIPCFVFILFGEISKCVKVLFDAVNEWVYTKA